MAAQNMTTRLEAVRAADAGARPEGQTISPKARAALDAWAANGDDELLRQASQKIVTEAKLKAASQNGWTKRFGG